MKRWVGVAVAAALLVGCASDGDDTAALCDGYEQHLALTDELLAPGVFDLRADELEALLDDRRDVSNEIADHAGGELRDLMDRGRLFGPAARAIMLREWRDDLDSLRAVGDGWSTKALEEHDELEAEDGSRIATSDWFAIGTQTNELLYVTCEAPELAGGPAQDRSEAPPDGTVSYFWFTDVGTATGDRLAVTPAGDEIDSPFSLPTGWRSPLYGDADGDRVVFLAADGERVGMLAYDANSTEAEVAYDGAVRLSCPSLSPGGREILAPEVSFSGDGHGIYEIRDGAAEALAIDLALQGCAADIGDDRLLVAPAARKLSDPPGAAVVSRDGSEFEALDLPIHCTAILGDVDEAQENAALTLRCGTPGDSGLWTIDLETLEVTHLVTGLVGTPKFSPDGEWLTYSFAPLGSRSSETGIWMMKADGTGARELVDRGAFPLWLDAE